MQWVARWLNQPVPSGIRAARARFAAHCGFCCASRSFRTSETSLPPPFEMARPRRPTDLLAELVSRSSQHEARPPGVGTATTCRLDLTGPLVSIVPQHPKHLSLLQKHVLPGRGLKAAEHFVFSLRSSSLLQPEALPARSRQTLFGVPFGSALATVREHSLGQRPRRLCGGHPVARGSAASLLTLVEAAGRTTPCTSSATGGAK